MMGLEQSVAFILRAFVFMIWLVSLRKLGSIFFHKKDGTVWKWICYLILLIATNIWMTGNYLLCSVTQQILLMLFFFVQTGASKEMCQRNQWERLGLAGVIVSTWEFVWNAADAVLSICNIVFMGGSSLPYLITILSFLITSICMDILFGRTKLAEGSFLRGSGKILFSVASLLLILIDLCNFGITRGIVMVSDNGAEYWDITHNELLTHLEVLTVSVLCLVICLSLLFGMNRLIGYITVDSLRKMEISRYQSMLEQYRKQANVRHDLKNHFISLSALAEQKEWDKLQEYLSRICNAGLIGEEDIETGNSVVNAIINTKRQTAKQKGIVFDCSMNIAKPLAIDEYDLCIIWGNFLDNAIKAAEGAEEKTVCVQAEIVKKNLIVSVRNSVAAGILPREFGRRNWGTGLKNVDKIVQRENGIMEIEVTDNAFEISIMLPIVDA